MQTRIRSASFGERFTNQEMELITLLMHIDTEELPELGDYRRGFFSAYFHLKQRIEHEKRGQEYREIEFDAWNRHIATFELKADLQKLILEGRRRRPGQPLTNGQEQRLHRHIRDLLINFCEGHQKAILSNLMTSRWRKVLRHVPGYEHPGEDLTINFKSWIRAPGQQEVEYIQHHLEYKNDHNMIRFLGDMTFLMVEVWLKLHEGHELHCGNECDYREQMGAKIRALYVYGCLASANGDGGANTPLKEILDRHIVEVIPLGPRPRMGQTTPPRRLSR